MRRNLPRPIRPTGTTVDNAQLQAIAKNRAQAFRSRRYLGKIPIRFSMTCRRAMQDLVGIVRTETEMQQALVKIKGPARPGQST